MSATKEDYVRLGRKLTDAIAEIKAFVDEAWRFDMAVIGEEEAHDLLDAINVMVGVASDIAEYAERLER